MTAPESPLGLGQALGWCGGYVGLLLLCALADVTLWRRVCPAASPWLNDCCYRSDIVWKKHFDLCIG